MDKNTLSNYGWIVIAVLVLSVMIALATPFGKYIENGVRSTTAGLFDTSEKAMNVVGMSGKDNSLNPALNHKDVLPKGAKYNGGGIKLTEGDEFPETIADWATYTYGDYSYSYHPDWGGWNPKVIDKTKTEYGEILESIGGIPIVALYNTFMDCSNLIIAPDIPRSVKSMTQTFSRCTSLTTAPILPENTKLSLVFVSCSNLVTYKGSTDANGDFSNYKLPSLTYYDNIFSKCTSMIIAPKIPETATQLWCTFSGCTSLTTAPNIPDSIKQLRDTFNGCTALTGTIEINANVTDYSGCFKNVDFEKQNLTLTGISPTLRQIGNTGINYQE